MLWQGVNLNRIFCRVKKGCSTQSFLRFAVPTSLNFGRQLETDMQKQLGKSEELGGILAGSLELMRRLIAKIAQDMSPFFECRADKTLLGNLFDIGVETAFRCSEYLERYVKAGSKLANDRCGHDTLPSKAFGLDKMLGNVVWPARMRCDLFRLGRRAQDPELTRKVSVPRDENVVVDVLDREFALQMDKAKLPAFRAATRRRDCSQCLEFGRFATGLQWAPIDDKATCFAIFARFFGLVVEHLQDAQRLILQAVRADCFDLKHGGLRDYV